MGAVCREFKWSQDFRISPQGWEMETNMKYSPNHWFLFISPSAFIQAEGKVLSTGTC